MQNITKALQDLAKAVEKQLFRQKKLSNNVVFGY